MALHTKRNAIIAGVAAVVAGLGITGAAAAQNGPDESAGASAGAQEQQDPSITGSVPAPQDGKGGESEAKGDETAEGQALQGLTKISAQQAIDAAKAAVPGTADKAELGDENGFVVYSVEVTAADGTVTDVKVDAGDGKVLAQETGEESEADEGSDAGEGSEAGETNEAPGAEQPEGSESQPAG